MKNKFRLVLELKTRADFAQKTKSIFGKSLPYNTVIGLGKKMSKHFLSQMAKYEKASGSVLSCETLKILFCVCISVLNREDITLDLLKNKFFRKIIITKTVNLELYGDMSAALEEIMDYFIVQFLTVTDRRLSTNGAYRRFFIKTTEEATIKALNSAQEVLDNVRYKNRRV